MSPVLPSYRLALLYVNTVRCGTVVLIYKDFLKFTHALLRFYCVDLPSVACSQSSNFLEAAVSVNT